MLGKADRTRTHAKTPLSYNPAGPGVDEVNVLRARGLGDTTCPRGYCARFAHSIPQSGIHVKLQRNAELIHD